MNLKHRRFLQKTVLAAAIAGISAPASASFFALAEQSASGLGSAFAGGAAIADDASTVWYNPAGMSRLDRPQLVVGAHYIDPSFQANVISATAITGSPISGGAGKDPGEAAVIPNIYYAHPLTKQFSIGGAINTPFGLTTEYDSTWAGRYHATRSDIKTVNFEFAGAYKFNDIFSAGAGVNYQYLKAELGQQVDFATLCTISAGGAFSGACGAGALFNPNTNPNDGSAKVTADSTAFGYNLGLLAQVQDDLRVGVAYRSKMKHSLSGDFDISTPANAAAFANAARLVNQGAKADVTLPASFSVSLYEQLSPQWALMADYTRTYWSSLPELRIKFDGGQQDSVVTLNLQNTNRISVGGSYKASDAWILRAGFAYDESPVTSAADRTPRLPDANRTWYTLGAGIKASKSWTFDFGYAYIKLDTAQVRKTATPTNENVSRGNLSVDYTGSIQILSAQARWTF